MRVIFVIVAVGLLTYTSNAQDGTIKVRGIVKDIHNKPVTGASVVLMADGGNSVPRTAATDSGGIFEFKNLKVDMYILTITSVGYMKFVSPPIPVDGRRPTLALPPIMLGPAEAKTLKDANVTSQKPFVEQQIDRVIVNVDAMITSAGSNALDVLTKSPGVFVGSEGDISLNGKGGVLVLIDNKPTYLSQQDMSNYLKSIPSGMLDKIELFSNPPARYEAAGNAVINIRLKKNGAQGLNGSLTVSYGQGVYWKSNDAFNISYRNKKINVFANLSYAGDRNYSDERFTRYYYNADGSLHTAVLMETRYKNSADAVNARVGMDYFISSKTTWGILLTGLTRPRKDTRGYNSDQYNGLMKLDSAGTGSLDGKYKWRNGGINLNFQHRFDKPGKEINADLDYVRYSSHGDQFSWNSVYLPDGSLADNSVFSYVLPTNIHIYSARADYTHPLNNTAKLEGGVKSSYVSTDNGTWYYDQSGGIATPDYGQTNHFLYKENINSVYANFRKEWRRWGAQAGLRLENTVSRGHLLGNAVIKDSSFERNYTNAFPTAYLSYKLDSVGRNTLVISYGRRIVRPNYQQLNPFLLYRDKYSYSAGNPYLNAAYNNHIELSYRYKHYLSISPFYDKIDGIAFQSTEPAGNIFITRPENLVSGHMVGLSVNLSLSPVKWWMFNLNGNLANVVNKGSLFGQDLDQKATAGGLSLLNQFRFGKSWAGEISGFFRCRTIAGQLVIDPVYSINAGLQKSVWKNKGLIRLKMDDIFYSIRTKDKTTALKLAEAFHTARTDSRVCGLSFTYRFGTESNTRKRNHTAGGTVDEQNRIDN